MGYSSALPGTIEQDRSPAPSPTTGRVWAFALRDAPASPAAVPALRHFARDAADRWHVPAEAADRLTLVVSELVTNAVVHSDSPDVSVSVEFDGTALTVEVKDSGTWRCRWSAPNTADEAPADGRGLEVVRHCTAWWLAFPSPTGTRVVARLTIDPSAG